MSQRNKTILAAAAVLLPTLSGCVDYTNRWDFASLQTGDAVQRNIAIHTVDPFPKRAHDTDIDISGKKSGDAYDRYIEPCDQDIVDCSSGDGPSTSITINNGEQGSGS